MDKVKFGATFWRVASSLFPIIRDPTLFRLGIRTLNLFLTHCEARYSAAKILYLELLIKAPKQLLKSFKREPWDPQLNLIKGIPAHPMSLEILRTPLNSHRPGVKNESTESVQVYL